MKQRFMMMWIQFIINIKHIMQFDKNAFERVFKVIIWHCVHTTTSLFYSFRYLICCRVLCSKEAKYLLSNSKQSTSWLRRSWSSYLLICLMLIIYTFLKNFKSWKFFGPIWNQNRHRHLWFFFFIANHLVIELDDQGLKS